MIKIILEVKINRQVIPGRKIQMKILHRKLNKRRRKQNSGK